MLCSIPGFVQIAEHMERHSVRFLKPFTIVKMEKKKGDDGPITVTIQNEETKERIVEEFDTVTSHILMFH